MNDPREPERPWREAPEPHPEDDQAHIVEIYSAANIAEASAVQTALDAVGIRCRVTGDLIDSGFAGLQGMRADPKIWVREEDAPAARAMIEDFQADRLNHVGPTNEEFAAEAEHSLEEEQDFEVPPGLMDDSDEHPPGLV